MRTLHHDGKTITVPDDVVDDYMSQGWQDGPSAPKPARPRKPRASRTRKPRASQPPKPEPTPEP